MSRILIWSPNYAPELIGIPPIVTSAAEWLAERGHEVDVVTAVPNYPERLIHPEYRGVLWRSERRGAVRVNRSWLRVKPGERFVDKALYELSFSTFSLPQVLRRVQAADVLVCLVPSLMAAGFSAILRRVGWRGRLVLWVQDLVIEGARAVRGAGSRAQRTLQMAETLERSAVRAADRVVVCSPGFALYFRERGADSRRIETIYNWVDVETIRPEPARQSSETLFLYSGNLGYSQGFETLVEAVALGGPGIRARIVGEGNAAADVRRMAEGSDRVVVERPVPEQDFPALLAAAEVHVVIQRRVSAGANLPSKIGPYLASGRPIVASIDADTPAAQLLRDSGGAIVVPPERPQELAATMRALHEDPALRAALGARGRAYAVEHLAREQLLPRLERAILG